jgi:hypothetical protein
VSSPFFDHIHPASYPFLRMLISFLPTDPRCINIGSHENDLVPLLEEMALHPVCLNTGCRKFSDRSGTQFVSVIGVSQAMHWF